MPYRSLGDLALEPTGLISLFVLYSYMTLCFSVCWPFGSVELDNTFNASVFKDHLLVVAATLFWILALDILAHDDIDSYLLSLFHRQAH